MLFAPALLQAVVRTDHLVAALLVCALLLTYGSVGLLRRYAVAWHLLDVPNERSGHRRPMPLGGGVALVLISGLGLLLYESRQPIISWQHVLGYLAGAILIATVSLIDDLGGLPSAVRLSVQGSGALILLLSVGSWQLVTVPLLGTIALGWVGVVLSLLWIVGLTNAFNFMDGADGLAGGQAVIAGLGWVVIGLLAGQHLLAVLGALLATTSLGFLLHNWHPARIFMGDVGATFLGYSFAALAVIGARDDPKLAIAGVLLVWPAIFDSLFTVLSRLRRGENIFAGHREFLFHRLLQVGWQPRTLAGLYMSLPLLGALLALSWDHGTRLLHLAVALALGALCGTLWLLVKHQERRHARQAAAPVPLDHVPEDAIAV